MISTVGVEAEDWVHQSPRILQKVACTTTLAPPLPPPQNPESKFTIACDRHTFNFLTHNGFSE